MLPRHAGNEFTRTDADKDHQGRAENTADNAVIDANPELTAAERRLRDLEERYGACSATAQAYADLLPLWDRELNHRYEKLRAQLPVALREQLRQAERAWLVFRDEEVAFINLYYLTRFGGPSGTMGTMYEATQAHDVLGVTKRRAESLGDVLGLESAHAGE